MPGVICDDLFNTQIYYTHKCRVLLRSVWQCVSPVVNKQYINFFRYWRTNLQHIVKSESLVWISNTIEYLLWRQVNQPSTYKTNYLEREKESFNLLIPANCYLLMYIHYNIKLYMYLCWCTSLPIKRWFWNLLFQNNNIFFNALISLEGWKGKRKDNNIGNISNKTE